MASDFETLRAALDATGVDHLVYSLDSGLAATQENLARVHDVPEDVVEAGGFTRGININGALLFFDSGGRYVGNTDTTRAFGPRFERPRQLRTVERVKNGE